jgi:hypothetical protein
MSDFVVTINEAELAAILADFYAASNDQRSNDFSSGSQSLLNVVNVAIAPPLPTVDNLQPTIDFATATVANSVAESGPSESNIVVTLLETLDDAGELAGYVALQRQPAVWFGTIQVIMNGLTDAQRTTINSLDIGSQVSVTKSFPNSTPSTVTQLMALEGISHDITPDRHIVTLYPNPARIYTYFIVGGYATTTTRTNLVPNPSFEVNLLNWTLVAGSYSRITTDSYSGVACAQLTKGAGRNEIFIQQNEIFVSGSTTYTISGYMKVPAGQESMSAGVRIIWHDSAGVQIAPGFISGTYSTLTSADGWQRRTFTATSPANAFSVRLYFGQTSGGTAGQRFLLDAVLVEATSSALPYFDGRYADTYTGYTLQSQSWSGTDNASTSTATWGLTSSLFGSQLDDVTKGLG